MDETEVAKITEKRVARLGIHRFKSGEKPYSPYRKLFLYPASGLLSIQR